MRTSAVALSWMVVWLAVGLMWPIGGYAQEGDARASADAETAAGVTVPEGTEDEQEQFFTLTSSVGVYSAYMFRSLNLYDGLSVQPSIQGTLNFGDFGNLSLIHWMQLPAGGEQYATKFIEMDEGIGYDFTWDAVTFSFVHYWYLYRNGTANTFPGSREVTATVSWDVPLQPYVMLANEYRAYKCQYYEIGLSHTFEREGEVPLNLTLFANSGFTSNATPYWEGNGYVQSTVGVSTDISMGGLTLTPSVSYSNGNDGYTTDQWWGGMSVSVTL
jgi:hypothetical protein